MSNFYYFFLYSLFNVYTHFVGVSFLCERVIESVLYDICYVGRHGYLEAVLMVLSRAEEPAETRFQNRNGELDGLLCRMIRRQVALIEPIAAYLRYRSDLGSDSETASMLESFLYMVDLLCAFDR